MTERTQDLPVPQPYRPVSDPEVRRAKRKAVRAWQAVSDAKCAGASARTVARLTAAARKASDEMHAIRGTYNPRTGRRGAA